MTERSIFRRLLLGALTACALSVAAISLPIAAGALTPAAAQVSGEFQDALSPYGTWRRHPQFGDVWVPSHLPRDWQPYQYGHWVYTDDWGWYWVSDETEADWGWVAYHYGRWAFERDLGWFWVPGDEWAPAWVDWRYSDDYVGWAPLPPDDLIDAYDEEPSYWVFVAPRYLTASRPRSYFVPGNRRATAFRSTRVVNRTVAVQGRRLAVNPGISAGVIASVTRSSVPAYRVKPRVLAGTQGVSGAVVTRGGPAGSGSRGRGRSNALSVQRTSTVIKASATVAAPAALGKGEKGRLGSRPPRAAQGAAAPAAAPAVTPATPATTPKAPAAAPAATPPAPPNVPPRQEPRRNEPPPAAGGPPPQPGAPPTQARPLRPPPPQSGPANPQGAPAARPAPQNAPAVARPPEPPRPAPPVAHPAPPPVVRPAPPPVAHPAPPPVAHPAPPKPPAAKPAPPAKPGEKPPEPPK